MYFKSRLIFTCIVWCSLPECGNTSNVFTVSHGTFTTFPLIFFCPPRGAANTFINGILGETSLHSTWCKSLRCCGISGKPIPFAVELGGNFFSFKWLKHVLQINSFPSHWRISGRHTSAAWQSGTLFLCTTTTLCLYHSWSHTQHLWTGPFPTSLWKFFIKSSMDSCLLRDIFFRAVSRICSRFLFTESFLAICFLSLLHSRSLSLYATSFLALCMLFLLDSRSLSLYAGSFLLGLVRCLSYSLNSDCVLACLFHSVLYCRLLSLSIWAERLSHVSLAAFSTLSLASALFFFLYLWAKSFWDCKYLSTIAWAEPSFPAVESTTELFLFDNSPLFDILDLPSQIFFAVFTSAMLEPVLTLLTSAVCALLSSLLRTLSCLCRCWSLFFFTFGMICQCIEYYSYSFCYLLIIIDRCTVVFPPFCVVCFFREIEVANKDSGTCWTVTWQSCDRSFRLTTI